jgi:cysteine desulfurase
MKNRFYLDYNATTPLRECARQAIMRAHDEPLNASAIHSFGRDGRRLIEQARSTIASAIACPPAQLIFNSGATEGNNTVLQYFARQYPNESILVGATEHPAVMDVLENARIIPVNQSGIIDLDALDSLLREKKTSLVSVMLANNETGIVQPITDLAAIVHRHGALLHSDATQAAGRIPVDMAAMGIDFITLSAHKVGGPQGVGALGLGLCGVTPVLLYGGGQEKKARAGTENIPGIAGFGAAMSEAISTLHAEQSRLTNLRQKFENGLKTISPECIIYGAEVERLPNTSLISVKGL